MQGDDPPVLCVGTDVSAKYKGAFCEAKIKKVVRNIKCKLALKAGGTVIVNDDVIKGALKVGNTVEVKQDPKKEPTEAIITKIQDCSQYTVVFDDGDITTLRRTALCLKSGRHFNESETLDQLPLTHPEHFSTPVIAGRRGRRGRAQSDESEGEVSLHRVKEESAEREPHVGRVVLVDAAGSADRRKPHQPVFPALVVAPTPQIKVKEDYLVRSFKDGRYYTVPKKEAREFRKTSASAEWAGVDAALQYLTRGELPPHWDRDALFRDTHSAHDTNSDDDSSDDEPREEKDHFVAQLYKFMDDRGTPLNRNPTIANRDVDLYRLFKVVEKLGSYNRVTNQNQWKTVASKMGFHPVTATIINLCKQTYKKCLHSFEDFYRKLGVTLVAHPRGARTPPAGRSLIRDRDKLPPAPVASPSAPPTSQVRAKEKETDKNETDPKAEKSDKEIVKVDKQEKTKPKLPRASDEEDSADNQPLVAATKPEKDKTKEKDKLKEKEKDKDKDKEKCKEKEKEKEKDVKGKEKEKPKEKDKEDSKEQHKEKEKDKEKRAVSAPREEKAIPRVQPKTRSTPPIKTEPQEKRIVKKRPLSSKVVAGDSSSSGTSRASRRLHASTDSDSSGRASRCGPDNKVQCRRSQSANSASSGNTITSNSSKRPRKRKNTEPSSSESPRPAGTAIKAEVGDKLRVYYGPTQSGSKVTYEAKVIEVSPQGMLRVHYTGWNTRYDEWINPQRIAHNVTQHENRNKKGSNSNRRVRQKRTEASSPHSDTDSDSDSDNEIKRSPKKIEDKSKTKTSIESKDAKSSDSNSSGKSRKRPIRSGLPPNSMSQAKKLRAGEETQGRDYDLVVLRSELKGLHNVKQEIEDKIKTEIKVKEKVLTRPIHITDPQITKQAEDVYEFKEPEPFEIELHDEKKKRTHRIFDDISPTKYTSTITKSLSEEISEETSKQRILRSPGLSPFRDFEITRDTTERQSIEEESKDELFSLDDDSGPGDSSSGPIFEGFTPAKNQETYSKRSKIMKLRKILDDSPESPADDEHSTEEDSDNTSKKSTLEKKSAKVPVEMLKPKEVTIKTEDTIKLEKRDVVEIVKEIPVSSPSPSTCLKDENISYQDTKLSETSDITLVKKEEDNTTVLKKDVSALPNKAVLETKQVDNNKPHLKSLDEQFLTTSCTKEEKQEKDENAKVVSKLIAPEINSPRSPIIDTEEEKSEPDSPARSDVISEPPPGFLLQSEGPKIAEKLLKAISSAKKLSMSPPSNIEVTNVSKPETLSGSSVKTSSEYIDNQTPKTEEPKTATLEISKVVAPEPIPETIFGEGSKTSQLKIDSNEISSTDTKKPKPNEANPPRLLSPLNIIERRKSIADLTLTAPGKNNKVLSDTIQKLSSQINQSASNLPLPPFQSDKSDSSDSDDSDRRLIIDKLAIEEWASGASSEASRGASLFAGGASAAAGPHAGKSPGEWSAGETLLMLEDACKNERKHSASVVLAGSGRGVCGAGAEAAAATGGEEESNLSLLLCEETIPGSPAPDADPAAPLTPHAHTNFASGPAHRTHSQEERASEAGGARRAGARWGRLLEHTPPTTPDSSVDMSPRRERRPSELDSPMGRKEEDEESQHHPALDMDKPREGMRSRKASESSAAGAGAAGRRGSGRRPRRDTDDHAHTHKYNFYVEFEPSWDAATRIAVLTARLGELRKAYLSVKAELAAVDRRRKKLRRKEREAVKAAKAACM